MAEVTKFDEGSELFRWAICALIAELPADDAWDEALGFDGVRVEMTINGKAVKFSTLIRRLEDNLAYREKEVENSI